MSEPSHDWSDEPLVRFTPGQAETLRQARRRSLEVAGWCDFCGRPYPRRRWWQR